jgi:hypothetical protein
MKKLLKPLFITFLFVSLILLANVTFADPPGPPPGHGSSSDGTPVGAPIDGGLSILLALGAGYGARKFAKARKEKKEADELTS